MPRILVVEDDKDIREALCEALELMGHEVRAAFDGREGLREFVSFIPSLVISDINMPVLDGLGLARKIRLLPAGRAVPLVAITGNNTPADLAMSKAAGFDAHMAKPADIGKLEALINSY